MKQGTRIIAPLKGGSLSVIDPETGEELFTVPVSAGVHPFTTFEWIESAGFSVQPASGTIILEPVSRIHVAHCPRLFETSANPEWVPSQEMRQQQMFQKMLTTAKAEVKRALNKERAIARAKGEKAEADQLAAAAAAKIAAEKAEAENVIEDANPNVKQS